MILFISGLVSERSRDFAHLCIQRLPVGSKISNLVVVNLAQKLRLYHSHGITRDQDLLNEKLIGPWYYEQISLGFNYRMTELHAAGYTTGAVLHMDYYMDSTAPAGLCCSSTEQHSPAGERRRRRKTLRTRVLSTSRCTSQTG